MQLTLRNAPFSGLVTELREQQDRKVDLIVPARDLWSHQGNVLVAGMGETTITDDGVTRGNLLLVPSAVYDSGVSSKLTVPGRPLSLKYLRGLRETGRTDLVDANVNGLLHGNASLGVAGDPRKFLVRTFAPAETGGMGYARALLSDSYKTIDNFDVLMSVMEGMTEAGLDAHVVKSADLTNDRMYIKVVVPEIAVAAPELLDGYRSPYSGNRGADNPTVFAGLVISNSDTGGGALTVTPCLEIEVCTNGMTITKDVVRNVHLGSKLKGEGVVQYSSDTEASNLHTIMLKTRDTVRTFLNPEYLTRAVGSLTEKAGQPVADPKAAIEVVTKRSAFTKADADGILDAFIKGGQVTRGGIVQAVTAFSQTLDDPDRAYAMDADALAAAGLTGVTGLVAAGR